MKLLRNDQGIAHLAVLLVISATAIGFVGWVSYNAWQENKRADEATLSQPNTTQGETNEEKTDPYANWEVYSDTDLKFTFKYPKKWTVTKEKQHPMDEQAGFVRVSLKSPNLTYEEDRAYGGQHIQSGASMSVYCHTRDDADAQIQDIINGARASTREPGRPSELKPVTVDGLKAVEYLIGWEGPASLRTTFDVGTARCGISDSDTKNPEFKKYISIYKKLVASVEIKS